jgi:hypothetical protein
MSVTEPAGRIRPDGTGATRRDDALAPGMRHRRIEAAGTDGSHHRQIKPPAD